MTEVERPVISPTDLQTIVTELAADGVWVAPSYAQAHGITRAEEQRLEEAVHGLARPVRVMLVEPSYDDPEYQGRVDMLVHAVHLEDDVASLYLVPDLSARPRFVNELDSRDDDGVLSRLAEQRHPDDSVAQLLEQIELSAEPADQVLKAYEQEVPERTSTRPSAEPEAGAGVWQVSGLIVAGLAVAMVGVAGWRALLRRRGQYRPSSALLRRAKGAEQRSRRERAIADAVNLAQRVADAPTAAATTQVALDHLEAAQRVLARRDPGVRDEANVVGALVLLARGAEALDGTTSFTERCWFHPLHAPAHTSVPWRDQARSVTVPACRSCAAAVGRGTEPADILDLADARGTRHWFHLDLGPWNVTAFGAFSTDLPGDLIREGAVDG